MPQEPTIQEEHEVTYEDMMGDDHSDNSRSISAVPAQTAGGQLAAEEEKVAAPRQRPARNEMYAESGRSAYYT